MSKISVEAGLVPGLSLALGCVPAAVKINQIQSDGRGVSVLQENFMRRARRTLVTIDCRFRVQTGSDSLIRETQGGASATFDRLDGSAPARRHDAIASGIIISVGSNSPGRHGLPGGRVYIPTSDASLQC